MIKLSLLTVEQTSKGVVLNIRRLRLAIHFNLFFVVIQDHNLGKKVGNPGFIEHCFFINPTPIF